LNNKLDTVTKRGDPKYKKRNPNEGKRKARKGKRRTAACARRTAIATFKSFFPSPTERNDPLKHRTGSGSWSYPSRKSSNLITVVLNFIAPFLVREWAAMSLMIYLFLSFT
jgi:hypothetical protein